MSSIEELLATARANADTASQQAAAGVGGNVAPPAPPIQPPLAPAPSVTTAPATPSVPPVQKPHPAPVPAPVGGTMSAMDQAMAQLAAAIQSEIATQAAEKAAADQAAANRLLVAQHLAAQTGHTLVPADPVAPAVSSPTVVASAAPAANPSAPATTENKFSPGLPAGGNFYWWPSQGAAADALDVKQDDATLWHIVPESVHRLNEERLNGKHKNGVSRIPRLAKFKWTL